ncbi:MAG: formyltetrahydrofolate deformylase [Bacteroidetes bacterium]|nr:formyltetrahydrofolate deformylase [Bacteroidota bacterium]
MNSDNNIFTVILSCPDRIGLVAKISQFFYQREMNITDLDEHVDKENKMFFIRLEIDRSGAKNKNFKKDFDNLALSVNANWTMKKNSEKVKLAVFVSKQVHCLHEILWLTKIGELNADIKVIISNHEDLRKIAEEYEIPFYHLAVNEQNKIEQENAQLRILKDNKVEGIVLARYMQILSSKFVKKFENKIINIHHSFLPAFKGADPYRKAFERGVKLIGATSHFVTESLDDGPIIEQEVTRITHKDSLFSLKRKGKDLERKVLARAVYLFAENKILSYENKTIIFD